MRVIRVLFGFALACLAAAATLVLFVYTPAELANLPAGMGADRLGEAGLFALAVTPHVAMFAALPALVAVVIGESRSISGWSYYSLGGIAIAVMGFLTQHFTEAQGQSTILHNYALTAFLTTGFVGGFAYWLLSGRYAGSITRTAHGEPVAADSGPAPHNA